MIINAIRPRLHRQRYTVTRIKWNPCVSGYMNSPNNEHWSANKPNTVHEVSYHDSKTGVWCAIPRRHITGTIFFKVWDPFYSGNPVEHLSAHRLMVSAELF
jgi:hypothetical protein